MMDVDTPQYVFAKTVREITLRIQGSCMEKSIKQPF